MVKKTTFLLAAISFLGSLQKPQPNYILLLLLCRLETEGLSQTVWNKERDGGNKHGFSWHRGEHPAVPN